MSNKSRKRLWPVSLVMAVAVVGAMAAFLMLASSPPNTLAHPGVTGSTHCDDLSTLGRIAHDEDPLNDHDCATGPDANNPPMAGAAIAAPSIHTGGTGTVQSTITDADADDTLTWTVLSSNTAVATAVVSNTGMVTVSGISAGMATITVTATDEDGEAASQSFTVTVAEAPATAPPTAPGTATELDLQLTYGVGMVTVS